MDRPMTTDELLPCVTIEPRDPANAAVIWLHGLGADGHDFEPIVPELRLSPPLAVRFVFPHAPRRPVTINGGMVMRAWYDISGPAQRRQEDEAGIRASEAAVRLLIDHQIARGIPARAILLAGFSQGGAIALQTGLRYPARLAGIAALSTWLPLAASLAQEASPANRALPILMAHGDMDTIIPPGLAERSRDHLRELAYPVEWHCYDMGHSVCQAEIGTLSDWLGRILRASLDPAPNADPPSS